nr:MAG TPA: hypothetical protein [Caudoviricetes sp.]
MYSLSYSFLLSNTHINPIGPTAAISKPPALGL